MNSIDSNIYPFEGMTLFMWHDIVQLRERTFVVEQNCLYQEVDGKDPSCHHIVISNGDEIIAYARIVPPELASEEQADPKLPSIGRVIVKKKYRGQKIGYKLMHFTIGELKKIYVNTSIFVSAQQHLQGFYKNLGFKQVGAPYLEVGIPHLPMILR